MVWRFSCKEASVSWGPVSWGVERLPSLRQTLCEEQGCQGQREQRGGEFIQDTLNLRWLWAFGEGDLGLKCGGEAGVKIQLGLLCTWQAWCKGTRGGLRGAWGELMCRKLVGKEEPTTNHRTKSGGCPKTAGWRQQEQVESATWMWHLGYANLHGDGSQWGPWRAECGGPGQWRHPAWAVPGVSGREGRTPRGMWG